MSQDSQDAPAPRPKQERGHSQAILKRIQTHAAYWYHSQDSRQNRDNVLTLWWACPDCRRTQSPAVNSGMEPVSVEPDGAGVPEIRPTKSPKPAAYLSAFGCRFCNSLWDVTIERVNA